MKTAKDPRHMIRREAVKELFAESYVSQKSSNQLVVKILKDLKTIDELIEKSAPAWPIDKLNRIDLAILRLAVFELKEGLTPPKVIIDEAVELSKEYGSENTSSFVNGVLGTILSDDGQK